MKYLSILTIATCLILTGCDTRPKERTQGYELPEELSDCRVYKIDGKDVPYLYVVRCPNSQTAIKYSCGKNCSRSVSTLEGV